ncbi:SH3 domain-binding glutamic acid-rich-like protein 3 [Hippocampus zosterae]|uniref:SH3 domain-binding glutamic acid-rich-like protein 3 n=1 Tax=Hippocampus zosterae TaxID=109293 RepID=UPI00223E6AC4|nr:SH3 domain-binding glutamic acid-rich-like protein 3 [Hippocampus zosterae]
MSKPARLVCFLTHGFCHRTLLLEITCFGVQLAAMPVKVFYTSVSGNSQTKKDQQKLFMVLESKKIPFERVDIAASDADKELMRSIVGDPKALPPQICNGNTYCGDMTAFEEALECEDLGAFLKI